MTDVTNDKDKRGFAKMDPEQLKAISQKGGLSVAKQNRAFSRDRTLAASAGAKGGSSSRTEQRARLERIQARNDKQGGGEQ